MSESDSVGLRMCLLNECAEGVDKPRENQGGRGRNGGRKKNDEVMIG